MVRDLGSLAALDSRLALRCATDFVAVAGLVLLAHDSRHIAETYRSMYAELCRLRDQPAHKTGLEEFVIRSQTKLDEFLPKLNGRRRLRTRTAYCCCRWAVTA